MRHRGREINIFSMSALDLFASGMGAFILIAVMALPFFPNTGDAERRVEQLEAELVKAQQERDAAERRVSDAERQVREAEARAKAAESGNDPSVLAEALRQLEDAKARLEAAEREAQAMQERLEQVRDQTDAAQQLAEARRSLEEARSSLAEAERRAAELERALGKAKLPDLDVVICLDVSGSMGEQIEGLKRQIEDLAKILDGLAPSAGIGVVAFGDKRWRRPIYVQDVVSTSRLAELERFVAMLTPGMNDPRNRRNSDFPEAIATALEQAVGLQWRSESQRRYIVAVTDAGAYPDRRQTALRTAQRFAAVDGQHVSAVMAWKRPDDNPEPFLRALASAGKGRFLDMAGGESMLASILLAILGT